MTDRFFLLLERQQKLDDLLGLAQSRRTASPLEIARLRARKRALHDRLAWLLSHPAMQPA